LATYPKITSAQSGAMTSNNSGAGRLQPFTIANYDGIIIGGVLLPLVTGSLRGGLSLNVEHRKAKGTNFKRYTSQGLDQEPVSFTLNLFIDRSKSPPLDWRDEFERVESRLIPVKTLDARNAIDVYHPSYAGRGINAIVTTKLGILQPVAVDRWTVDVSALDVRSVSNTQGKATKAVVAQDSIHYSGTTGPATVVSPASHAKNITGRSRTYPGVLTSVTR
jgi:hypothetical protein